MAPRSAASRAGSEMTREKPGVGLGLALAKRFAETIGFFWHADHQQIYRVLRRLKDDGLVDDVLVIQHARPNKRVYSITAAGRDRLVDWSREEHVAASVKDDLLVKVDRASMHHSLEVRVPLLDHRLVEPGNPPIGR